MLVVGLTSTASGPLPIFKLTTLAASAGLVSKIKIPEETSSRPNTNNNIRQ
jgi:hypothetical protein